MTIRSTLLGIGAILWLAAIWCWLRARGSWRLSREAGLFALLGLPFVVAGLFFTASSYPLEVIIPTPSPAAPPVAVPAPAPAPPTPAPADYAAAVNAAQHAAVARYPDLGKAGSAFNTRFVAIYRQLRTENPAFFTDPQWPLHLADRIARTSAPPP